MRKRKTEYLSYLEDTKKYHIKIADIAILASNKAVENAKSHGLDITYLKGEAIVKESPYGNITVIDIQPNKRRIVEVGSKDKLSKRS